VNVADMSGEHTIWDRLATIDRRIIFLVIAVTVGAPFFIHFKLPISVTPPVQQVYDEVESLKPGDVIMLVFDYAPSSMPELNPMAVALLRHAFRKDLKVIACTILPPGAAMAQSVIEPIAKQMQKTQGEDWVNLGFKPGGATVILGMNKDIHEVFPEDYGGRKVEEIPLMQRVHSYADIPLLIDLSGTNAPESWIAYARVQCGQKVAAGITAVMAADFYPYLDTGKLSGMLGGLRGAAEYEKLVDAPDFAIKIGMPSQTWAHAAIVLFVIIGNIAYAARRRAHRGEQNG